MHFTVVIVIPDKHKGNKGQFFFSIFVQEVGFECSFVFIEGISKSVRIERKTSVCDQIPVFQQDNITFLERSGNIITFLFPCFKKSGKIC